MMKKCTVLVFSIIVLFFHAHGQVSNNESTPPSKNSGKPNIPGNFVVELGVNQPIDKDSLVSLGFWGSRTVNIYYQYELRLFKSKFSLVPGIGFSLERYKFKKNNTLGYTTDANGVKTLTLATAYPDPTSLKKSMVVTNYLEIPVELRFSTRPEDPARSFKMSIGGRFGYLMDSFNKIKYKEDHEKNVLKDKQRYAINRFRYGAFAKIGGGNFSVFSYYDITPLFEKGEGLQKAPMKNFTVGISLSGF